VQRQDWGQHIDSHLRRYGQEGCLVCSYREFEVGPRQYSEDAPVNTGQALTAVCQNCGFFMTFDTNKVR
jgi:hypothetical protein